MARRTYSCIALRWLLTAGSPSRRNCQPLVTKTGHSVSLNRAWTIVSSSCSVRSGTFPADCTAPVQHEVDSAATTDHT
ncbi:hypothetical protein C8Q73DRAFT_705660 [Cubamyces lactineus]|nr:hypothetical protein C8Q73DRAFT_705660 [Cubamyces lactineus]